jgi:DMSO/TMAO reductase YedYZ molybdopterin-dependent catalytic subunit
MTEAGISREELQLATRNHGMPLEALRYDITPVGLHYLLVHYDIPEVAADSWRLEIGGAVERSLTFSLDDLRGRPAVELAVTMECAGNGRAALDPRPVSQPWLLEAVGTARWRGAALAPLLEEAGASSDAKEVLFTGLDEGIEGGVEQAYQRSVPVELAREGDLLLAYEMNGAPLPPQHGFPLRLVVPGWYGMTNVKWLSRVDVLAKPFAGYQQAAAYRFRQAEDEEGEPVQRMVPRALMIPPGRPDFLSRERTVDAGPATIEGKAWSGSSPVATVDVSTDGGASWSESELGPEPESRWAWRRWSFEWDARPGSYELCARARDEEGRTQPLDPPWNLGGYANNAVQRVPVTVR